MFLQAFIEWGQFVYLLSLVWLACAFAVAARRARLPRWWAHGLTWICFLLTSLSLLWIIRHEYNVFMSSMNLLYLIFPYLIFAIPRFHRAPLLGYQHMVQVLAFRPPSEELTPTLLRQLSAKVAPMLIVLFLTPLLSFSLVPCRWLDVLLSVSGCRAIAAEPGFLHDVAVSSDGKLAAAATMSGVTVWSSPAMGSQQHMQVDEYTKSVAFSPDGALLAVSSVDSDVRIWRIANEQLVATFPATSYSNDIAFSPDGVLLAIATRDGVQIWNISTQQLIRRLITDTDLYSVAFSHDGRMLAGAGLGGHVLVWRAESGELIYELDTSTAYALAFSPDDTLLAAATSQNRADVWQMADGQLRQRFEGQQQAEDGSDFAMWDVQFSADGQDLVAGSGDQHLRVWGIADGALKEDVQVGDQIRSMELLPGSSLAVLGVWDNTVKVWELGALRPAASAP